MESYFFWTLVLAVLALLSAGAVVFVRAYLAGTSPSALLFRPRGERRLEVVDHASVDSRRKLVLIRRDDVEHLLLTGGPVDVVIETGIKSAAPVIMAPSEAPPVRRTPVFAHGTEPMMSARER
jgi:flagellar protein FliO/FliZ